MFSFNKETRRLLLLTSINSFAGVTIIVKYQTAKLNTSKRIFFVHLFLKALVKFMSHFSEILNYRENH